MKTNYWTNHKKYQLYVLHSAGCSIKTMGAFFDCSTTAINKSLYRFGIRQAGKSPKLQTTLKSSVNSLEGAKALIEAFELDYDNAEKQCLSQGIAVDMSVFKPSGNALNTMKAYDLNTEGVWESAQHRIPKLTKIYSDRDIIKAHTRSKIANLSGNLLKNFFLEERRSNDLAINAPFDRVVNYLREKGKVVEVINHKMVKIDNKTLTDSQILIMANRKRLSGNLPIFHVNHITKH